ncbi:hypothetical protein WUBG_14035, partial [Wuchereria bancrofti]
NPVAEDAGQYKCNIKNDLGETNANLTLNFEQEPVEQHEKVDKNREKDSASPRPASRQGSRLGSPKKQMKSREGTPKKSLKSREGTPRKSIQSETATPTQGAETNVSSITEMSEVKTEQMEVDSISAKRKSMTTLPPKEKKSRQKSPRPKSKSPRPETLQVDNENTDKDRMMSCTSTAAASNKADHTSAAKAREVRKIPKDSFIKVDEVGAQECRNETPKSITTTKTEETKMNQITKHSLGAKELGSNPISESELEKSTASIAHDEKKHSTKSREPIKKKRKRNRNPNHQSFVT